MMFTPLFSWVGRSFWADMIMSDTHLQFTSGDVFNLRSLKYQNNGVTSSKRKFRKTIPRISLLFIESMLFIWGHYLHKCGGISFDLVFLYVNFIFSGSGWFRWLRKNSCLKFPTMRCSIAKFRDRISRRKINPKNAITLYLLKI